jgi:hypothetical protein
MGRCPLIIRDINYVQDVKSKLIKNKYKNKRERD